MDTNNKLTRKVQVSLRAGKDEDSFNFTAIPITIDFIYGIATGGLSDFEGVLGNMEVGEAKRFDIAGTDFNEYFGNLSGALQESMGLYLLPARLFVEVTLISCVDTSPSEVVKAMAQSIGHGSCGGGCDCGCG